MSAAKPTASRFRRLLKLLALLPARPIRNMAALARDLQCDERTVRRHVAVLVEAGIAHTDELGAWLAEEQLGFVERLVNTRPQVLKAAERRPGE